MTVIAVWSCAASAATREHFCTTIVDSTNKIIIKTIKLRYFDILFNFVCFLKLNIWHLSSVGRPGQNAMVIGQGRTNRDIVFTDIIKPDFLAVVAGTHLDH